jgi:hypothetical protein
MSTKICSIDGCEREVRARGLCINHNHRQKKLGLLDEHPPIIALASTPLSERLLKRIVKVPSPPSRHRVLGMADGPGHARLWASFGQWSPDLGAQALVRIVCCGDPGW